MRKSSNWHNYATANLDHFKPQTIKEIMEHVRKIGITPLYSGRVLEIFNEKGYKEAYDSYIRFYNSRQGGALTFKERNIAVNNTRDSDFDPDTLYGHSVTGKAYSLTTGKTYYGSNIGTYSAKKTKTSSFRN